ncbi:MAG: MBL fold metallo-hydrolase [Actinomycetota bacterium]|nr:MBL fold metallo-hydrolase [Actinomycetota bacterium]
MADDPVAVVPDDGLGNSAYLVDLGDGRALAVDACRDLRALRRAAEARGLRITYAADTHLHADFLSGATQLAATDDARVIASAAGNREFPHLGLEDEQAVDLGGLSLRAMATPGHTGEHLAYVLLDGADPLGVFTGGSLIAGSAARTDLVDPGRTEELARAQYRSLRRLAELPDAVEVWPTHGGGSFCSAGAAATGVTSTIGAERSSNPLLNAPDEDTFTRMLLSSLGSFPPYFLRLGDENRRGPGVLPDQLSVEPVGPTAGHMVIDVRPPSSYAALHPAGALSIPLRPAFASWLGWLVPHDEPLLVLRDADQDLEEILWQAAKIGYTNIVGEVTGGIDAWVAAGLATEATPLREAFRAADLRVLDIRQRAEYAAGHVPGAIHIELGRLPAKLGDLADVPTVVMCGHGERALTAASVLSRSGLSEVTVLDGGPDDWARANGLELTGQ